MLKRRKRFALIIEEDRCGLDLVEKISQTVGVSLKEDGVLEGEINYWA
jgi:hypothetical protein